LEIKAGSLISAKIWNLELEKKLGERVCYCAISDYKYFAFAMRTSTNKSYVTEKLDLSWMQRKGTAHLLI
jgi:hypothetical protein